MLKYIDSDVICVNETHLQGDATLEMEGIRFMAVIDTQRIYAPQRVLVESVFL